MVFQFSPLCRVRFSFLRRFSLSAKLFHFSLLLWGVIYYSALFLLFLTISIHAPRMGSDYISPVAALLDTLFSIHAPCVGSVNVEIGSLDRFGISIHAPRMGNDHPVACNHKHLS